MSTSLDGDRAKIEKELAGFLHRSDTVNSPTNCSVRVRLTPSGPSKAGSVWFVDSTPVNNGFETSFTFQISDHSKECTARKDNYFSKNHYTTCSVRGADGFAFVIHNDPRGRDAVGGYGGQLGFGGIQNSLAIAFDIWPNPGLDQLFTDQIKFQSRGKLANDGLVSGLLGLPKATPLADGNVHLVRIVYYGSLVSKYFNKLVASDNLNPYLRDNGEQKRVGTLVVFVDDGVAKDEPLMAMPINLSLLLDLPDDKAYVGFTAATGRFYAKHDILSWHWCDEEPCQEHTKADFDYHQTSQFSSAQVRQNAPGEGFGGGDISGFPTKNKSPDTTPWVEEMLSFSASRNIGLSGTSGKQVPPETLF